MHCRFSQRSTNPTRMAASPSTHRNPHLVAPRPSQVVAGPTPHWSPSHQASDHARPDPGGSVTNTPDSWPLLALESPTATPMPWGEPLSNNSPARVTGSPSVTLPKGQHHPRRASIYRGPITTGGHTQIHTGNAPRARGQVTGAYCASGPHRTPSTQGHSFKNRRRGRST